MTGWDARDFATADAFVDALLTFFETRGQGRYEEDVTQLEHALQTAALARAEEPGDGLVVAALLHDIGHLLVEQRDDAGASGWDRLHEVVGARFVRRWFGPEIADPVALHVAAKRYLVGSDPAYAATLSSASIRSLAVQGGPLHGAALDAFAQHPDAQRAIALRRWDDQGKMLGGPTPSLTAFEPMLRNVVRLPGAGEQPRASAGDPDR